MNVNRDAIDSETHLWTQAPNLNGPSDKTVAVLKFDTPEGRPIAAYIDYAMHPVNGWLAGFTSADFAGAPSRYVEQAYHDNMVAVFAYTFQVLGSRLKSGYAETGIVGGLARPHSKHSALAAGVDQ